jgi:hypothetical protein
VPPPPELPTRNRQTTVIAPTQSAPVSENSELDLDFFNSSTTLVKNDEDDPFSQKAVIQKKNELDDFFS